MPRTPLGEHCPTGGGSLQRYPDPVVGLRGPTSKGKREEKGREEGERKGTGGTDPPFRIFMDSPLYIELNVHYCVLFSRLGLTMRLDLVSCWLFVTETYLCDFMLLLSHCLAK